MDIVSFKQTFDPLLARHLASQHDTYTKITSNSTVLSTLSHIQKVSAGGKRLRPYIVWSLYASQKPDAKLEDIQDLLLALELFHVFCLIHDDVMDNASTRHGTLTIQAFTTELLTEHKEHGDLSRAGKSQAILAGDILFNQVYELLARTTWASPKMRDEVRSVFTTLVDEVCIGQMLDIDLTTKKETDTRAIVEKNKLKTAYYSFARPLHIGALISGRDDIIDFVISFGEQVGMLFQIQDDLLDIIGKPEETKKELLSDLRENQHTVLTEYIRKKADPVFKEKLEKFCGTDLKDTDYAEAKSVFVDSGAVAYAQALTQEYINESQRLIKDAHLDQTDEKLFNSIISLLAHRTA
ncbi:MAG: polyprenyl synthetase family protein [Candidatus Zambryskibacteria bacterium]|nr:polyprenyl synthetase family protein [Candidatus Zambryskibacteria bacterium]